MADHSGFDIVSVIPDNHQVTDAPAYIQTRNEYKVFDAHRGCSQPLLLSGPKGCGKTLAIASWAQSNKSVFVQYDCNEGTKESHLVGRPIITSDGTTPFKLGIIPTVIELANKVGSAVLVLEEINALRPAMQKLLNPLLDWRSGIYVESLEKEYKLNPDCKVMVFATSNPSGYMGVNDLNEDLKSRFAIWQWHYPDIAAERTLLDTHDIPDKFVEAMLMMASETRALAVSGEVDYALSTRDIASAFTLYRAYSADDTLKHNIVKLVVDMKVLGHYELPDHTDVIMSRIESIFPDDLWPKQPKEIKEVFRDVTDGDGDGNATGQRFGMRQ